MRLPKSLGGFLCLSLSLFFSCETDDIKPALNLSSDSTILSEDSGTVIVTATLNSEATSSVNIPMTLAGSAILNTDYSVSSNEIVISSGATSGSVTFTGLQNNEIEGTKTITVGLGNSNDFLILSNSEIAIEVLDDDVDSDGDGVLDANDECPDEAGEIENNGCPFVGFLINEVLYDPPSDLPGDANGDGTRSPLEDEFIEFINSGPELDLSGYTISDADEVRHVFPDGSILPVNGILVIFGGGTPTGDFGGAIVQIATSGQLNMSNSGDLVTLADPNGNPVLTFDIEPLSNNPDESYTRNPDLTGEFVQHSSVDTANGALFSPGTRLDGTNF
jgi:hypothetical protein